MSREKNFLKNSVILFIGTALPKISAFITLPLYTAYLSKAEYGTYDLIMTLVSLLVPIVSLMLPHATFRFLLEAKKERKSAESIISNSFFVMILSSVVALVLLYFCLGSLQFSTKLLICMYLLINIVASMCQQVTRGFSKNHIYSLGSIITSFSNIMFVSIALCILDSGLDGVIICMTMSTLVSVAFIIRNLKIFHYFHFTYVDRKIIRELLQYSVPLIFNNISSWVMNMSDRVIVLCFLGVEWNAVLAVAHKIPQIVLIFQNVYSMAWQENAILALKDEDIELYYSNMFNMMYDILVGFTMILISSISWLFPLLVRGDYEAAYYQIPIYIFAFFLSYIATYLGGIYLAYKKTVSVSLTTIASAIINIVVNIFFINHIGLFAASISTVCGYIFIDLYRYLNVQKLLKIRFDVKRILLGLVGIFISIILCYQRNIHTDIINIMFSSMFFYILNRKIVTKIIKSIVSFKIKNN